jgi:hypothetical protein
MSPGASSGHVEIQDLARFATQISGRSDPIIDGEGGT